MFASGTQEEPMKSIAAANTARGAFGFEWFGEADHGVIGDVSANIRISEFLQQVITHFHESTANCRCCRSA
jgi:hypothetical protein